MKARKTILLRNDGGKETQENYPISTVSPLVIKHDIETVPVHWRDYCAIGSFVTIACNSSSTLHVWIVRLRQTTLAHVYHAYRLLLFKTWHLLALQTNYSLPPSLAFGWDQSLFKSMQLLFKNIRYTLCLLVITCSAAKATHFLIHIHYVSEWGFKKSSLSWRWEKLRWFKYMRVLL